MQEKNFYHITVGSISTNCWIYPFSKDTVPSEQYFKHIPPGLQPCAVIDPGAEGRRIAIRLRELKLFPIYILLTHGHFDHITAVPELVLEYRDAQAKEIPPFIAIHKNDAKYLGPQSCPHILLEEGSVAGPFTVLHLPGHTKGSIAFWDKEAKILFSGDTMFKGDYGRTDLPGGSEEQIQSSLKRLHTMDGDIKVCPGHGPVTNIENERC